MYKIFYKVYVAKRSMCNISETTNFVGSWQTIFNRPENFSFTRTSLSNIITRQVHDYEMVLKSLIVNCICFTSDIAG